MNNISISIKNKIIIPILMKLFFIFIFCQPFINKVSRLISIHIFYEKLDNFLSDYINDINIKILYTYILMTIYILPMIYLLSLIAASFWELMSFLLFSDTIEFSYLRFMDEEDIFTAIY